MLGLNKCRYFFSKTHTYTKPRWSEGSCGSGSGRTWRARCVGSPECWLTASQTKTQVSFCPLPPHLGWGRRRGCTTFDPPPGHLQHPPAPTTVTCVCYEDLFSFFFFLNVFAEVSQSSTMNNSAQSWACASLRRFGLKLFTMRLLHAQKSWRKGSSGFFVWSRFSASNTLQVPCFSER